MLSAENLMSSDPNKKTARTFQCRDILWDAFQQMAQELECSVDYLINESMKQYARQRYAGRTGGRTSDGAPPSGQTGDSVRTSPPAPPQARAGSVPLPPPPTRSRPPYGNLPPPPLGSAPPAPRTVPPPLPGTRGLPPPTGGSGRFAPPSSPSYSGQLSIMYAGERLAVNKDRFVIGRGKQSSDLTIKDPNVSRQHAMIEFLNGQYYMVDMGSTNGVEYNGQRISRRPIAEGDVYRICDHEVRFTYR